MSDPSIREETAGYERWRGRRIQVVAADLAIKHEKLKQSPFVLLRGTYYRFLAQFERLLPELARAPSAVAVGDLHVENFGTWRDRCARLVWGVNDFDEIDILPYPIDLVRLATSAVLAISAGHLALDPDDACEAIRAGWRERIGARRGEPFVLGERNVHLYKLAREAIVDPAAFEKHIRALAPYERALPKSAARMLAQVTPVSPSATSEFRPQFARRVAGVGSLGSRRIVAYGELDGGLIVREAKQIPGPASTWAQPERSQIGGLPGAVQDIRGVAADPSRRQSRKWVLRALTPDATRLELGSLSRNHSAADLLHSMGQEAANIHHITLSGTASVKAIRRDEESRAGHWLRHAAEVMVKLTQDDWRVWCS
ncbi:MAG: DUF2252 family protein [Solirubrobacteraceae bacterium]